LSFAGSAGCRAYRSASTSQPVATLIAGRNAAANAVTRPRDAWPLPIFPGGIQPMRKAGQSIHLFHAANSYRAKGDIDQAITGHIKAIRAARCDAPDNERGATSLKSATSPARRTTSARLFPIPRMCGTSAAPFPRGCNWDQPHCSTRVTPTLSLASISERDLRAVAKQCWHTWSSPTRGGRPWEIVSWYDGIRAAPVCRAQVPAEFGWASRHHLHQGKLLRPRAKHRAVAT